MLVLLRQSHNLGPFPPHSAVAAASRSRLETSSLIRALRPCSQVLAAAFVGRTEHDFGFYANSAIVILVAGLLGNTLLPLWCAHPASDELGLSLTRTSHAFASVGLAYARSKAWQYGSMILEFVATFVVWALMLGPSVSASYWRVSG